MSTEVKPRLQYHLIPSRNPNTGETTTRPIVANREIVDEEGIVRYAVETGVVVGNPIHIRSVLAGLVEVMRQLVREGKSVNICNWVRVYADLCGTADPSGKLSKANYVRTIAVPMKSARVYMEDIDWEKVD